MNEDWNRQERKNPMPSASVIWGPEQAEEYFSLSGTAPKMLHDLVRRVTVLTYAARRLMSIAASTPLLRGPELIAHRERALANDLTEIDTRVDLRRATRQAGLPMALDNLTSLRKAQG
jgi:hypothetical protein